jgi:hypothetical protein
MSMKHIVRSALIVAAVEFVCGCAPKGTKSIIKRLDFTISAGFAEGRSVPCPSGAFATGGGATAGVGLDVVLLLSAPNSSARGLANNPEDGDRPDAWYVYVRNDHKTLSVDAHAYVVCVSP